MASEQPTCSLCVLMKDQCDKSSAVCQHCVLRRRDNTTPQNSLLGSIPCTTRGSLVEGLDSAFSNALQINHSQWMFPQRRGAIILKIDVTRLTRDAIRSHAVLDLPRVQGSNRQNHFLNQFCDISSRWGNNYEPIPEDVIVHAAEYQKALLDQGDPEITPVERQVVLNALRCLVHANAVDDIANYIAAPDRFSDEWCNHAVVPEAYILTSAADSSRSHCVPKVKVDYKLSCDLGPQHNVPRIDQSNTLCGLIKTTFKAAETLLLRKRLKDWPTLFYVLYILHIVKDNLSNTVGYTTAFQAPKRFLDTALKLLGGLFLVATGKNLHPMTSQFDHEWYSMSVTEAVHKEHYLYLNQIWQTRDDSVELYTVQNFTRKLDNFATGFIS